MYKQRYEYYNGSTTIIDNELDTYVEDVVDRLNTQDFNKNELLKVKQRLESKVADLEAKLAEYQNDGVGDAILNAGKKIKELEQQLAEKEKEYKFKLKEMDNEYKKEFKTFEEDCKHLYKTPTKKAIDELEKVKKSVLNLNREEYLKRFYELEDIEISRNNVVDIIDKQIKDLRNK